MELIDHLWIVFVWCSVERATKQRFTVRTQTSSQSVSRSFTGQSTTHGNYYDIGIQRNSKLKSGHTKTVDEHIQSARRCAYSLMGAGLPEQNGVNPVVSFSVECLCIALALFAVWSRHFKFNRL